MNQKKKIKYKENNTAQNGKVTGKNRRKRKGFKNYEKKIYIRSRLGEKLEKHEEKMKKQIRMPQHVS